MVGKPTFPDDVDTRADKRGSSAGTPGLTALDEEREASLADEGGASGARTSRRCASSPRTFPSRTCSPRSPGTLPPRGTRALSPCSWPPRASPPPPLASSPFGAGRAEAAADRQMPDTSGPKLSLEKALALFR